MSKEKWQNVIGLIVIVILTFLFGSGIAFKFCSSSEDENGMGNTSNQINKPEKTNSDITNLENNIEYTITTKLDINEYLMIEKQYQEELYSVYQYSISDSRFSFFRCNVDYINLFEKRIKLNIYLAE